MRGLLYECMPKKLALELPEHDVRTVVQAGWSGTKSGALLRLAAESYDVFLTVDQNLQYQQDKNSLPLPVVVLVALSNDIDDLTPLMPSAKLLLSTIQPNSINVIDG